MSTAVVALPRESLAAIAPNYEAMRQAIAKCERVDEIAKMADLAVAAQAYYRQSLDVENEMNASRIRVRAERRMGELLKQMRENGQRDPGGRGKIASRHATQLADLGIPRDRASRAMQLADVPEEEFEAALEPDRVAQPRRILREIKDAKEVKPPKSALLVPIEQTLDLWGGVRDFGEKVIGNTLPPLKHWRENMQPFQIAELRRYLPPMIEYLTAILQEIEHGAA